MSLPQRQSFEAAATTVLETLAEDTKDFWAPRTVRRLEYIPSAVEFLRDYVSNNTPVIIPGLLNQWEASKVWNLDYLSEVMGSKKVTVDITPDGNGDCIIVRNGEYIFVKPEERQMEVREFAELLMSRDQARGIPYLSHQNDSMNKEFDDLLQHIGPSIGFASEAFGNTPDAVNIWIGDERAVSSLHKDHYENMYAVVRGQKRFMLLPPSAVAFLPEKQDLLQARYRYCSENKQFKIDPDELDQRVSWIEADPSCQDDLNRFPLLKLAPVLYCDVNEGETLYLPSMWYHKVTQTQLTIAVNFWHDMCFDCKYVYYNLAKGLKQILDSLVLQPSTPSAQKNLQGKEVAEQAATSKQLDDDDSNDSNVLI